MDAPTLYICVLHDDEGSAVESAFNKGEALTAFISSQDRDAALAHAQSLNVELHKHTPYWSWIVLEYAPVPF